MVIEAFGMAPGKLTAGHQNLAADVPDERQLAGDGLSFMKGEVGKRWKGRG